VAEFSQRFMFNFVIIDGLKVENGFLVRYFSDNSLQGDLAD
jgi:hypothetical protein